MNNPVNINPSSFWMKPSINIGVQKSDNPRQLSLSNNEKPSLNEQTFKNEKDEINFGKKNDPLNSYPLRICAYTNEVGAALSPIPVIGAKLFMLSWVPALLYFGADIYDKYAKGNENDYSSPSRKSAVKQATFQALASVLLPTAAVIAGQKVATKISGFISKDKMDISAKEDILTELKRDLNQEKLRKHRKDIAKVFKENPTLTVDEVTQLPKIKEIKRKLADEAYKEIKIESASARRHRKDASPIKKFFSFFAHSKQSCEHLSIIDADKFDSIVKPYLDKQVSDVVNTRVLLQRALDPGGVLNEHSKELDKGVLKKLGGLLKKNIANRDILDKNSYVVKECVISKLDKVAMKLSIGKIAGGFAALALLAKPIDHFVHNVVISKVFEPKLNSKNN